MGLEKPGGAEPSRYTAGVSAPLPGQHSGPGLGIALGVSLQRGRVSAESAQHPGNLMYKENQKSSELFNLQKVKSWWEGWDGMQTQTQEVNL